MLSFDQDDIEDFFGLEKKENDRKIFTAMQEIAKTCNIIYTDESSLKEIFFLKHLKEQKKFIPFDNFLENPTMLSAISLNVPHEDSEDFIQALELIKKQEVLFLSLTGDVQRIYNFMKMLCANGASKHLLGIEFINSKKCEPRSDWRNFNKIKAGYPEHLRTDFNAFLPKYLPTVGKQKKKQIGRKSFNIKSENFYEYINEKGVPEWNSVFNLLKNFPRLREVFSENTPISFDPRRRNPIATILNGENTIHVVFNNCNVNAAFLADSRLKTNASLRSLQMQGNYFDFSSTSYLNKFKGSHFSLPSLISEAKKNYKYTLNAITQKFPNLRGSFFDIFSKVEFRNYFCKAGKVSKKPIPFEDVKTFRIQMMKMHVGYWNKVIDFRMNLIEKELELVKQYLQKEKISLKKDVSLKIKTASENILKLQIEKQKLDEEPGDLADDNFMLSVGTVKLDEAEEKMNLLQEKEISDLEYELIKLRQDLKKDARTPKNLSITKSVKLMQMVQDKTREPLRKIENLKRTESLKIEAEISELTSKIDETENAIIFMQEVKQKKEQVKLQLMEIINETVRLMKNDMNARIIAEKQRIDISTRQKIDDPSTTVSPKTSKEYNIKKLKTLKSKKELLTSSAKEKLNIITHETKTLEINVMKKLEDSENEMKEKLTQARINKNSEILIQLIRTESEKMSTQLDKLKSETLHEMESKRSKLKQNMEEIINDLEVLEKRFKNAFDTMLKKSMMDKIKKPLEALEKRIEEKENMLMNVRKKKIAMFEEQVMKHQKEMKDYEEEKAALEKNVAKKRKEKEEKEKTLENLKSTKKEKEETIEKWRIEESVLEKKALEEEKLLKNTKEKETKPRLDLEEKLKIQNETEEKLQLEKNKKNDLQQKNSSKEKEEKETLDLLKQDLKEGKDEELNLKSVLEKEKNALLALEKKIKDKIEEQKALEKDYCKYMLEKSLEENFEQLKTPVTLKLNEITQKTQKTRKRIALLEKKLKNTMERKEEELQIMEENIKQKEFYLQKEEENIKKLTLNVEKIAQTENDYDFDVQGNRSFEENILNEEEEENGKSIEKNEHKPAQEIEESKSMQEKDNDSNDEKKERKTLRELKQELEEKRKISLKLEQELKEKQETKKLLEDKFFWGSKIKKDFGGILKKLDKSCSEGNKKLNRVEKMIEEKSKKIEYAKKQLKELIETKEQKLRTMKKSIKQKNIELQKEQEFFEKLKLKVEKFAQKESLLSFDEENESSFEEKILRENENRTLMEETEEREHTQENDSNDEKEERKTLLELDRELEAEEKKSLELEQKFIKLKQESKKLEVILSCRKKIEKDFKGFFENFKKGNDRLHIFESKIEKCNGRKDMLVLEIEKLKKTKKLELQRMKKSIEEKEIQLQNERENIKNLKQDFITVHYLPFVKKHGSSLKNAKRNNLHKVGDFITLTKKIEVKNLGLGMLLQKNSPFDALKNIRITAESCQNEIKNKKDDLDKLKEMISTEKMSKEKTQKTPFLKFKK